MVVRVVPFYAKGASKGNKLYLTIVGEIKVHGIGELVFGVEELFEDREREGGRVDAYATESIEDGASSGVLCRRDLLQVGRAVVDGVAVDVVNLHAGCAFTMPRFVHGEVTSFGMERRNILVISRTAASFAGAVWGVGNGLFGEVLLPEGIVTFSVFRTIELRVAAAGFRLAVVTQLGAISQMDGVWIRFSGYVHGIP